MRCSGRSTAPASFCQIEMGILFALAIALYWTVAVLSTYTIVNVGRWLLGIGG